MNISAFFLPYKWKTWCSRHWQMVKLSHLSLLTTIIMLLIIVFSVEYFTRWGIFFLNIGQFTLRFCTHELENVKVFWKVFHTGHPTCDRPPTYVSSDICQRKCEPDSFKKASPQGIPLPTYNPRVLPLVYYYPYTDFTLSIFE